MPESMQAAPAASAPVPAATAPAVQGTAPASGELNTDSLAALLAEPETAAAQAPATPADQAPADGSAGKADADGEAPENSPEGEAKADPEGEKSDDEADDAPKADDKAKPGWEKKRIDKLTAQKGDLKRQLDALSAQLAERDAAIQTAQAQLTAKETAAAAQAAGTHEAYLATSPDEVSDRMLQVQETKLNLEIAIDRASDVLRGLTDDDLADPQVMVKLPNGEQAAAQEVAKYLRKAKADSLNAQREMIELTKAHKFVSTRAAQDAEARKAFPDLSDAAVEGIFKEIPVLRTQPNRLMLAGQILAGRKAMKPGAPAKPSAAAPAAPDTARHPPVPSNPAAAPAATRPAVKSNNIIDMKKFVEGGASTDALARAFGG